MKELTIIIGGLVEGVSGGLRTQLGVEIAAYCEEVVRRNGGSCAVEGSIEGGFVRGITTIGRSVG